MSSQFIALLAVYLAAANGCTFCVVHESSKFEADCQARGGHLQTTATQQRCVLGPVPSRNGDDEDAGH